MFPLSRQILTVSLFVFEFLMIIFDFSIVLRRIKNTLFVFMGREDWYRNTSWGDEIEAAFRERLKRSRQLFHKAQYLRIQGNILLTSKDISSQEVGISLMKELLNDYPDNKDVIFSKFEAYVNLGDYYYYAKENLDLAFKCYKNAVAYDESMTTGQGHAIMSYIKTAVFTRHKEDYTDCLLRLEKADNRLVFPHEYYELGLSGALLYNAVGRYDSAKVSATTALQAIGTDFPFKRGDRVYGKAFATEAELLFLTSITNREGFV